MKTTQAGNETEAKPRYIMIGGFLGAGKTTAVGILANRLKQRGFRVGLITNDQGSNLVDTALLRSQGHPTEEIAGGCFCCRFPSLVEASRRLAESSRPQVFIAEPVGSCTDLAATVSYPMRSLHGGDFTVAPVSVLLDPVRAMRAFGLESGDGFSEKVLYIYHKQIEEADIVVVGKCDLLDHTRLDSLRQAIASRYPGKKILAVSSRDGTNLDEWFDLITTMEQTPGTAMEVDYETYADGEALLGWLNGTARLVPDQAFDASGFLRELAVKIQTRMRDGGMEIAHLKMTMRPGEETPGVVAAVNLVRNDFVPEISHEIPGKITAGKLIINLRAEAAPETLGSVVRECLETVAAGFPGMRAGLEHLEHFRPGKPTPTHRISNPTI